HTSDSLILDRAAKDLVYEEQLVLPQWEDYNRHSTEVFFPKLKTDNYLVTLTQTGETRKKGFNFGFLKVSDLVLSQTTHEEHNLYRILDRTTGRPVPKVSMAFFDQNNNLVKSGLTDEKGELVLRKQQLSNFRGKMRAVKEGDTITSGYWSGYYSNANNEPAPAAKSLL